MAEEDIVQNLIRQLGQSQPERDAAELEAHFVDVDERKPSDLLAFARRLAPHVRYYASTNQPDKDWQPFFRSNEADLALVQNSGTTTPHLALLAAFLKLYEKPREVINRITGRHLDFFYRYVLGFWPRAAEGDHAHVLVELKNNAPPVRFEPEQRLTAGKDTRKIELLYKPVGDTIIRRAKVASLRSFYVDRRHKYTVHAAPIANSADGLGGEWEQGRRQDWSGFGSARLPAATIGFSVASPVLRMAEGLRQITCTARLDHVDLAALANAGIANAFDAFVTGAKGWLGPYSAAATVSGNALSLAFEVRASAPALVNYDRTLHGLAYSTEAPVVQFVLKSGEGTAGYENFRTAAVRQLRVSVSVSGVTSLALESDFGPLDPKRAFLPFGPMPAVGSRFVVGYDEALSKKLSELKIRVRWLGPLNFAKRYKDYTASAIDADHFTASATFHDGGSWSMHASDLKLFDVSDLEGWNVFTFNPSGASSSPPVSRGMQMRALMTDPGAWARKGERNDFKVSSARDFSIFERFLDAKISKPLEGAVLFKLNRDFLHGTYRVKSVKNAVENNKIVLEEPYTPTIQAIQLSYTAASDNVDVSSRLVADFSNPDVQFFQIDGFGQRRDHGYRRANIPFVASSEVPLLPDHDHEGELLVGLEGVRAQESVSLLMQVADATANPDLPPASIQWSALCDNEWKRLTPDEIVSDTSNQLRRSGVVYLIIPAEATNDNTILPTGLLWLRAAVDENAGATCRLISVAANAVEVEFVEPEANEAHLLANLPPGKIAKLKTPLAGVKAIAQPYASFGGRPVETTRALNTRASERLRHKNRCITAWDYERVILQGFPGVHRVKCVPHAREGAWLAPGHVMLVVVPDLRNRTSVDPLHPSADLLEPRVDIDTLTQIQQYVQDRCGPQISIHTQNPLYQKVQLSFQVKFHRGRDFNYFRNQLSREIVQFLSPWAFDTEQNVTFGGQIYKSVLIDFVEELPYVDYVTSFNMFTKVGTTGLFTEVSEAVPTTPDTILVSDIDHTITEVTT